MLMNRSLLTDDELWQFVRQSQEWAFTALMERHFAALLNYGRKFSYNNDLVQDCVQDVLVDLWQRRSHTQTIQSIRAYLFTAVRNRVCRRDQQDQRFGSLTSEVEEAPFTIVFSIEDEWIANEIDHSRLTQLNAFINQLPPRQKEIIYLRFYQGLDNEQIAAIMDINYQSVSNLLHRALAKLRTQFPTLSLPTLLGLYLTRLIG